VKIKRVSIIGYVLILSLFFNLRNSQNVPNKILLLYTERLEILCGNHINIVRLYEDHRKENDGPEM